MVIRRSRLEGVLVIEPHLIRDQRGYFVETWHVERYAQIGVPATFAQDNRSCSVRNTLRGLHYQTAPFAQSKLVRCSHGAIYDVIVDLRPESSTFMKWAAAELSAENRRLLYVPEGCAHGYQALTDGAEVFYQVSAFYHPPSEGGLRWDAFLSFPGVG